MFIAGIPTSENKLLTKEELFLITQTGERGEDVASMATPYVDIPLGNNNLMELRGVQTTWRKLSSETLKGPVKWSVINGRV